MTETVVVTCRTHNVLRMTTASIFIRCMHNVAATQHTNVHEVCMGQGGGGGGGDLLKKANKPAHIRI